MALTADMKGVLVRCASCSSTNRLRFDTLDRGVRCGKCQTALAAPAARAASPAASPRRAPMIPVSWVQECEKLDIRRYPDGRTPQNIEMARSERRLSLVTRNLEESSRTIDQRIL